MRCLKYFVSLIIAILFFGCICAFAENDEWVCPGCGALNTTNYCTKCGIKRPETIVCPDCGTSYLIDSGVIFCGNCGAKLQKMNSLLYKYEGSGFSTPEEALTCYIEGFKNLDFEQILSAFAWESQMENYSFQALYDLRGVYDSIVWPRMPSTNSFMFSVNVNALRSEQTRLIYYSLEEYIMGDNYQSGEAIVFQKDSDDVILFLKKFENGKLEKLSQMDNIRFISPDDVTNNKFSSERNRNNFHRQNARYKADETVNIVGIADVGDETFFCCPTICRYGEKWYLVSVNSMTNMILGLSTPNQAFVCLDVWPTKLIN